MNVSAPFPYGSNWFDWLAPGVTGFVIMIAAIAYPRAGQAAMVLAGDPTSGRILLPVQGTSIRGGHLIVRMPTDRAALDALMQGIVTIAVPERICGAPANQGNT